MGFAHETPVQQALFQLLSGSIKIMRITLTVLVMTIDALRHFETG